MNGTVIVAVAPNGARRNKGDHPALPMTATELAAAALACRRAGASMIHLHVRDDQGRHSLAPDRYRAAIAAIRAVVGEDLLIQATTEAVGLYTPPEQIAAMDALAPEAFSVAVRELFAPGADETAGATFLARHAMRGALVQYILYDDQDIRWFQALLGRGTIPLAGASVIFPLGRYAPGQRSVPADLLPFLASWSGVTSWMMCAFGPDEAACAVAAACLGGHVRVGFENNLHLPDGSLAPDNAALVAGIVRGLCCIGRRSADAAQTRALLRGRS